MNCLCKYEANHQQSAIFAITVQVMFISQLPGRYFHKSLNEDTSSAFTPTICSDFVCSYISAQFISLYFPQFQIRGDPQKSLPGQIHLSVCPLEINELQHRASKALLRNRKHQIFIVTPSPEREPQFQSEVCVCLHSLLSGKREAPLNDDSQPEAILGLLTCFLEQPFSLQ